MTTKPRIAVIGSGVAGLACARRLAHAGIAPVILDKGRGLGGRLATRREGNMAFDHGAQYVTARSAGFAQVLQDATAAGSVAPWASGADKARFVGVPGMSALAKHLAKGLDIHQGETVQHVRAVGGEVEVASASGTMTFDRVVLTAPAPQTMVLLGDDPLADTLASVALDPCLTLMAATHGTHGFAGEFQSNSDHDLGWIALNSSKPGRSADACWVAQASPDFSTRHLERDKDDIAARMLPLFCEALAIEAGDVAYATAHRWRYARVKTPLGQDFASNATRTIYAGGDWCQGPRVEAAWISGDAMARDMIKGL